MESRLRVAILDYPKLQLENTEAAQLFSDMIRQKQMNFERTSKSFVVMDKNDMIGTHFLVYDTADLLNPKLVGAIRNTYEVRAKEHGVPLPIDNYASALSEEGQKSLAAFRKKKGQLVDCNAWFVDPAYSKSQSNFNVSEILFLSVCLYIYRLGYDHFVGAGNETYKATRLVEKVGTFQDGLTFIHPAVRSLHKLTLVTEFHREWLFSSWKKYGALMEDAYEVIPNSISVKKLIEVTPLFLENSHSRAA